MNSVANLTGVSKAMLGQFEREQSCPTIAKLWQISSGLGTSFSAFLSSPEDSVEQNSAEDALNDSNIRVATLSPYDTNVGFEMLKVSLFNQHHQQSEPHVHGVIETIWLLEGKLELFAEKQWVTIKTGELFRFHADQHHEYKALKDKVVFQNIISYPN